MVGTATMSPHLAITESQCLCVTTNAPASLTALEEQCLGLPRDPTSLSGSHLWMAAQYSLWMSPFGTKEAGLSAPPRPPLWVSMLLTHPTCPMHLHSGSAKPRHHAGPGGLPKASRHQVGSEQTGSLSGDECRDLPFYSRITTRK